MHLPAACCLWWLLIDGCTAADKQPGPLTGCKLRAAPSALPCPALPSRPAGVQCLLPLAPQPRGAGAASEPMCPRPQDASTACGSWRQAGAVEGCWVAELASCVVRLTAWVLKRGLLAHLRAVLCCVLLQGQAGSQPPLKPSTPGSRPGTAAAAAVVTPAQRQEQRRQERLGGRERREEHRLRSALAELRLAHLEPAQEAAAAELQSLLVESLVADKLGGGHLASWQLAAWVLLVVARTAEARAAGQHATGRGRVL